MGKIEEESTTQPTCRSLKCCFCHRVPMPQERPVAYKAKEFNSRKTGPLQGCFCYDYTLGMATGHFPGHRHLHGIKSTECF